MFYSYVFYQIMQVACLFGWYTFGTYELITEAVLFTFYFYLEALLVYVLIYFQLSSFTLKSNVTGDSSVQIMAIDPNGKELFRFALSEEAM